MSVYSIKTTAMRSSADSLATLSQRLKRYSSEISNVKYSIDYKTRSRSGIDRSLNSIIENTSRCADKANLLKRTLSDASAKYVKTESEILQIKSATNKPSNTSNNTKKDNFIKDKSALIEYIKKYFKGISVIGGFSYINPLVFMIMGKTYDTKESKSSFLTGSIKKTASASYKDGNLGIEAGIAAEGSLAKWKGTARSGLETGSVEVSVGTGKVAVKGKCALFDDGAFKPSIGVGAEAEVKGINGKVSRSYGNEKFDVHGNLDGTIGHAKAEAGINFDLKKGVFNGKAEAGAAVFKGKATGGFKIFGYNVDFSVDGEALAVGASAEFGKDEDSVTIGGKLAAGLGLGFKIKISK